MLSGTKCWLRWLCRGSGGSMPPRTDHFCRKPSRCCNSVTRGVPHLSVCRSVRCPPEKGVVTLLSRRGVATRGVAWRRVAGWRGYFCGDRHGLGHGAARRRTPLRASWGLSIASSPRHKKQNKKTKKVTKTATATDFL